MTKNSKEMSKKCENRYRKKINGAYTYLWNENDKRNGKMLEKKVQLKLQGLDRVKRKKMDDRDIAGS